MTVGLSILNVSIGLTGMMLCLLGLLLVLVGSKTDRRTARYLCFIYITLFLFAGSNLAGQLMRGHPGRVFRAALYISNFVEFLSPAWIAYLASLYLLSIVDPERERAIMRTIMVCLVVGHTVILLVSQFTNLYYYIDAGNVYHRNEVYALSYLPPAAIIGMDIYLLICAGDSLTKKERLAFSLYLIIPCLAMAVQIFIYGVFFIVFAVVVAAMTLYVFIISDQTDRYNRQVEENADLRSEIMLSQIRPHFIFNSLGAIRRLCRDDPEAREAVSRFALYLRGNLDSLSQREPVPFTAELEHTKAYLDLEKLRFGDDLTVEYDLETTEFLLPTLTLQPLVENAVNYGVRGRESGVGKVTVATRENAEAFEIAVSDDGPGFDPDRTPEDGRTHIGLSNVRERLQRMCSGELRIESEPGKGSRVTIVIPKEREHAHIRH